MSSSPRETYDEIYTVLKDMKIDWKEFSNTKRYLLSPRLPDKVNCLKPPVNKRGG
jgi:hypothetical protein